MSRLASIDYTMTFFHGSSSGTSALGEAALIPRRDDALEAGWMRLADHTLLEWAKNPEILADDGLIPPSAQAFAAAFDWIKSERETPSVPSIPKAVPDGDGGLSFRWDLRDDTTIVLCIDDHGFMEVLYFKGDKLTRRQR